MCNFNTQNYNDFDIKCYQIVKSHSRCQDPTRRLAISKRWEYRSAAVTVSCERKGTQYLIDSIAVFSVPRTGPPIPVRCRQETFLVLVSAFCSIAVVPASIPLQKLPIRSRKMCKVERRNFHPLSLRVKWQIMKPENASALIKKTEDPIKP